MLKIGITGGIGSGKSTVSKIIKEQGIEIIDADKIARDILNIYPELLSEIRLKFGNSFFDNKGNLLRKKLGNYIFKEKDRVIKLDNIMIPKIKEQIFAKIEFLNTQSHKICVLDAPTLIEQNLYKDMDKNILVWVDNITQIERIKNRDALNDEEIINRIKAQMPLDEKRKYVDYVIDNSGSIEKTKEQVLIILSDIDRSTGEI